MEVAGVTLAVFPLVIKGLSNLVEAVSTVKRFKHYYRELKRDARMIENEWTGFQLSIENLVSYVGHGYEDSQVLLKSPGGGAWKDPKFQKSLQVYLGDSYHPFVQTIEDLLEDLELLCEKLNIDSDTHDIQEVDFFRESISRFKHTFGQAVYKEIFDRIRSANDFLRRTTFQSQASHPWRVQGKSRMKGAGIARLRKQVSELHQDLTRRDRWSCLCRDRHMLNFHLSKLDGCLEASKSEAIELEVAIGTASCEIVAWPLPTMSDWKMVRVECAETADEDETREKRQDLDPHRPIAKVKFKFGNDPAAGGKEQAEQQKVVSDLCAAIQSSCSISDLRDLYLGHLQGEKAAQHQHGLFRAPWPWSTGKSMQPVSELLAKLGQASHVQQGAAIFPRRSRLLVAGQLALSVLILDGSWLGEDWSSADILLIRDALQGRSMAGTIRQEDALLLPWTFQRGENQINRICSGQSEGRSDIRCATLFALGLTLIELSLGARLEDLKDDVDENPEETVRKRKTAFRLLPRVEEQDGEEYANVVERCLDCLIDVPRRDVSFENAKFRELVYESIVKPLKENTAVFAR